MPKPGFKVSYMKLILRFVQKTLRNSYTMGCPPVRGDNPRALASGLSYVQVDKHGITILYHLHQCIPCKSRDICRTKVGKGGINMSVIAFISWFIMP